MLLQRKMGVQMAERLRKRAINQKVAGLIPIDPWARHFSLQGMSLYLL